jgi:betaine-aldehyde dehydrogenase
VKLQSINPHDQSLIGELDITPPQEISKIVSTARSAFPVWKQTPIASRIEYLQKYRQLLIDHKTEIAELVTKEMGKPLNQSLDDIDSELPFVDYYITAGPLALAPEIVLKTDKENYQVTYEPHGVCAVITPWNFPVSMFNSGVLPALLSGNTVVVKPSEYATLSQKLLFDLLTQTGIPAGVVNLIIGGKDTGAQLVDADLNLVWFTGSTTAGLNIYAKCGAKFIKCICEMGGSSPALVFSDANLGHALEQIYWGRFLNTGQVCSAIKRLFVQRPILGRFTLMLKDRLASTKIGNPLSNPDLGPLVNPDQLTKIKSQIANALSQGAQILTGGTPPSDPTLKSGNYFLPTLLTNIKPDMQIMTEEVFGPILPIIPFDSEQEAIQLANSTPYGLTAEIYTQDPLLANRLAQQIDAGVIAINTDSFFKPQNPFGGFKKSGIGREYGTSGLREFCQIKSVVTYSP